MYSSHLECKVKGQTTPQPFILGLKPEFPTKNHPILNPNPPPRNHPIPGGLDAARIMYYLPMHTVWGIGKPKVKLGRYPKDPPIGQTLSVTARFPAMYLLESSSHWVCPLWGPLDMYPTKPQQLPKICPEQLSENRTENA